MNSGTYRGIREAEGIGRIAKFRAANGVVRHNPGASLVDLGDGVACLELHSKKNAVGEDIVRLVTETFSPGSNAVRDFEAFVVSGDAEHFSVGANLMQLLLSAQDGEWDDVDFAVRAFQRMTASIKFCPRPVVVAPYSFCLGGGAEIAIHGARRQAHAELYMGLVETGVGVVPAGGGCKEMLLRALDVVAAVHGVARNESPELLGALRRTFETIAMAKVSTSAVEARQIGMLLPADRITMNRERLLHDAKESARELAASGYSAPVPRTRYSRAGREHAGIAEARGPRDAAGRVHQRPRCEGGELGGVCFVRRAGDARHAGERAVFAGSGAGGVPFALRGEEDSGADRVHVEEREAAEELANGFGFNAEAQRSEPRPQRKRL